MLFKTSTWFVQEAQQNVSLGSSSKRQLTVYDDIVLKSVYGNMLGCDESFNVTGQLYCSGAAVHMEHHESDCSLHSGLGIPAAHHR